MHTRSLSHCHGLTGRLNKAELFYALPTMTGQNVGCEKSPVASAQAAAAAVALAAAERWNGGRWN